MQKEKLTADDFKSLASFELYLWLTSDEENEEYFAEAAREGHERFREVACAFARCLPTFCRKGGSDLSDVDLEEIRQKILEQS